MTCAIDGCARSARRRGWCAMHYSRWLRSQTRDPSRFVRLPLAPLAAHVRAQDLPDYRRGLAELARQTGVHVRQVQRWKHSGIPLERADSMAIALGLHPAEVWGDEWWEAAS